MLEYPYSAFEKVFRLNVFGVFALIRQLIPILERSGSESDPARIINIGSVNGQSSSVIDANFKFLPLQYRFFYLAHCFGSINIKFKFADLQVSGVAVPHLETYAYSSSKAALHMLTKTLAARLAKKQITVNAILPVGLDVIVIMERHFDGFFFNSLRRTDWRIVD